MQLKKESNLQREMCRRGISCREIAALLGENDFVVEQKINGEKEWLYGEAVRIRDSLFPEDSLESLFEA